jgi:urate oxidase
LACPEEHFLANLAIFYQQDNQPSPKKSLYKLGDAVLLRYHQINME